MPKFNFLINELLISGGGRAISELKTGLLTPTEAIEEEDFDKRSLFGTPVYSNLEIPAGEYTDLDGNKINFQGLRCDTVLFDISQDKNIIMTAVSGKNGTIKQYIADGDFLINCQGIVSGLSVEQNEGFQMQRVTGVPEEEIRKFKAICSVPKEIDVVSEFLDFFGVSTVVITAYNFAQQEGSRTELFFNLRMVSDMPIELK